jgi:hypothetical protein
MGINRATTKATGRRWPITILYRQHIFAVIEPPRLVISNPGKRPAEDNRRGLDPILGDLNFTTLPLLSVSHHQFSRRIAPSACKHRQHSLPGLQRRQASLTCFNAALHGCSLSRATQDSSEVPSAVAPTRTHGPPHGLIHDLIGASTRSHPCEPWNAARDRPLSGHPRYAKEIAA